MQPPRRCGALSTDTPDAMQPLLCGQQGAAQPCHARAACTLRARSSSTLLACCRSRCQCGSSRHGAHLSVPPQRRNVQAVLAVGGEAPNFCAVLDQRRSCGSVARLARGKQRRGAALAARVDLRTVVQQQLDDGAVALGCGGMQWRVARLAAARGRRAARECVVRWHDRALRCHTCALHISRVAKVPDLDVGEPLQRVRLIKAHQTGQSVNDRHQQISNSTGMMQKMTPDRAPGKAGAHWLECAAVTVIMALQAACKMRWRRDGAAPCRRTNHLHTAPLRVAARTAPASAAPPCQVESV